MMWTSPCLRVHLGGSDSSTHQLFSNWAHSLEEFCWFPLMSSPQHVETFWPGEVTKSFSFVFRVHQHHRSGPLAGQPRTGPLFCLSLWHIRRTLVLVLVGNSHKALTEPWSRTRTTTELEYRECNITLFNKHVHNDFIYDKKKKH